MARKQNAYLAKMEENAKRDLGMLPEEPYNPESIRGKFVESTTHLKRKKESGGAAMSPQVAVVLIVVLAAILGGAIAYIVRAKKKGVKNPTGEGGVMY